MKHTEIEGLSYRPKMCLKVESMEIFLKFFKVITKSSHLAPQFHPNNSLFGFAKNQLQINLHQLPEEFSA